MRTSVITVILFFLNCASQLSGDVVYLKDGTRVAGSITDIGLESDSLSVKSEKDGQKEIPWADVEKIDRTIPLKERQALTSEYREKKKNVAKGDADGNFQLGVWCKKQGLNTEARASFEAAVAVDPEHAGARAELGHVKFKGKWMTASAARSAGWKSGCEGSGGAAKSVRWQEVKLGKVEKWDFVPKGLKTQTEHFLVLTDQGESVLKEMAALAENTYCYYKALMAHDIGRGWEICFLGATEDFQKWGTMKGSQQTGGGGFCELELKLLAGCADSGHDYAGTIKHEMAHAFYWCPGPYWLREGFPTLMEGVEWIEGRPVVKPNKGRLQQLKEMWAENKHNTLSCCAIKGTFPLWYAHMWSFNYWVYQAFGEEKYVAMLKKFQNTAEKDDLTPQVEEFLGQKIDVMEKKWKQLIGGL